MESFKKLLIICVIGSFGIWNVVSQNFIYHGNERYESTETWQFLDVARQSRIGPQITIGKAGKGGVLLFSIEAIGDNSIEGNFLVFLENGVIITCMNRNLTDNLDNRSLNLYLLTPEEVLILKKSRIVKVRYNISQLSRSQSYSAINKKHELELSFGDNNLNYTETEIEVQNLFNH